jgi:hypothetical protein
MGKKPKLLAGSKNLVNREPDRFVCEDPIHCTDANNKKDMMRKLPHAFRNSIANVGHAPFEK